MNSFNSGLIMGFACGSLGVAGLIHLRSEATSNVNQLKIFERDSLPPIIRIYEHGTDFLFLENSETPGLYIPLNQYLETNFPDQYDGLIERTRIEKLAFGSEER